MGDLPPVWILARLGDVVTSFKGKKPKNLRESGWNNAIPYIDICAFETGEFRQYADPDESRACNKEDVLLVWDGARSGLTGIGYQGALGSTLVALSSQVVISHFLRAFLQSQYEFINGHTKGTGIPHVDPAILWDIDVPLPPLAEQHRIVEKLRILLARVDACRARLEKIPTILKRFRQSVLSAACSTGELIVLGEIMTELKYGTSKPCARDSCFIPVLRIPNIGDMYINQEDMKYGNLTEKEARSLTLKLGDILLIRSNGSASLVGKAAIVSSNEVGFAYAGYLMRLRFDPARVLPDYMILALSTQQMREQIEIPARSTSGVHNINAQEIKKLSVHLPPLPEQREIVRRVEALFQLADTVEKRYAAGRAAIDRLTQSILAKAFRGDLVPQDPNDEPAAKLLEGIMVEREKVIGKLRAKRSSGR